MKKIMVAMFAVLFLAGVSGMSFAADAPKADAKTEKKADAKAGEKKEEKKAEKKEEKKGH
ncbi:MAG: hypothetical protein FJ246_05195 [Nitrospira sp.]|nr:hypothetical protein [Nitrospira sp.]